MLKGTVISFSCQQGFETTGRVLKSLPDSKLLVQYLVRPDPKFCGTFKPAVYEYWAVPYTVEISKKEILERVEVVDYTELLGKADLTFIKDALVDRGMVITDTPVVYIQRFFVPDSPTYTYEIEMIRENKPESCKRVNDGILIPNVKQEYLDYISRFVSGEDVASTGGLATLVREKLFEPAINVGASKLPPSKKDVKRTAKSRSLGSFVWKHMFDVFAMSDNPDIYDYAARLEADENCYNRAEGFKYLRFKKGVTSAELGEVIQKLFAYLKKPGMIPEFAIFMINVILPKNFERQQARIGRKETHSDQEDISEVSDAVDSEGNLADLVCSDDEISDEDVSSREEKLRDSMRLLGEDSGLDDSSYEDESEESSSDDETSSSSSDEAVESGEESGEESGSSSSSVVEVD